MSQTDQFQNREFPDKNWKRAKRYIEKLNTGERVLLLGNFSGIKTLVIGLIVILGIVFLNRCFLGNTFVMMACNISAMLAAFEMSKAVSAAQNAVAVVTDRRIIGVMETKTFEIKYQDIRSIGSSNRIFLDTGSPRTSIRLKYMSNANEFYQIVQGCCQQAHLGRTL